MNNPIIESGDGYGVEGLVYSDFKHSGVSYNDLQNRPYINQIIFEGNRNIETEIITNAQIDSLFT